MAQEGSIGADASLVVVVDGSQAIRQSKAIADSIKAMSDKSTASLNKMSASFNKMRDSMNNLPMAKIAGGITVAFAAALVAARSFANQMIEVNRVYTGFIATMNTVKGTVTGAEKEYAFLLSTSNKLGVEVKNAIPQYAKLSAALKNVDKDGELTRHLFTAISEAAVVLHSRGRDVTLIFEAFQQMASKGKLSLEELQRQLGNTLPGAVGLAARAMKMSEAELRKGIEKGTIDVYEFLAKVANQLKLEYGGSVAYAASQFTARMNVMRNAVFEFYRQVGSHKAMESMIRLMNVLIEKMESIDVVDSLGESIASLVDSFTDMVEGVGPEEIKDFFGAIDVALRATGLMFNTLGETIQNFYPDSKTPMTEFAGFMAQWAGGVIDLLRVVVYEFLGAISVIKAAFYDLQIMATEDFAKPAEWASGFANLLGVNSPPAQEFLSNLDQTKKARDEALAESDRYRGLTTGVLKGDTSLAAGIKNMRDQYRDKDNTTTYKTVRGGNPRAASEATDYLKPKSEEELMAMVDKLGTSAPNSPASGGRSGSGRGREENRYLSQRGSLLRDLNKLQNQYNNLAEGRAESEGENVAKVRSLIEEDTRYSKLTQAQKQDLMLLAQQLDDTAKAYEQLAEVTAYVNETNRDALIIEQQLAQLRETGYTSKYNQKSNLEAEFMQGGKYFGYSEQRKNELRAAAQKRDDQARSLSVEQFTQEVRRSNEELLRQQDLLGMTRQEVEIANALREIEVRFEQESVGLTGDALENMKQQAAVLKGEVLGAYEKINQKQQDIAGGLKDGLTRAIDEIGTPFERFSDYAVDSIGKIGDAFTDWITTGKMDFRGLASMMLAELAKIIFQLYVMKPLLEFMQTSLGGTSAPTGTGGIGGGIGNMIGSVIGSLFGFANGGVFDNSVNKFARGASFNRNGGIYGHKYFQMGEMGESGPEAIMPLARDSSGVLGVRMAGGSGADSDNIQIVVNVANDGGVTTKSSGEDAKSIEQLGRLIGVKVRQVIQDEQRVGGLLAQ